MGIHYRYRLTTHPPTANVAPVLVGAEKIKVVRVAQTGAGKMTSVGGAVICLHVALARKEFSNRFRNFDSVSFKVASCRWLLALVYGSSWVFKLLIQNSDKSF